MQESMKYVDLYTKKHSTNATYGTGATHLLPAVSLFVDYLKPKTILDYGCGKGGLVRALQAKYPNIQVYGYDPAVPEFNELKVSKVDFVTCTDVLEHIPENQLVEVIERISKLTANAFFYLHHAKASEILENGENAHCTVQPPEWYHKLIGKYFKNTPLVSLLGFSTVNTGCITFSVPDSVIEAYSDMASVVIDDLHAYYSRKIQQQRAKIKQLLCLLNSDFSQLLPEKTVFYGYGETSRAVLKKVKNTQNVLCFLDRNPAVIGEYMSRPIMSIDEYKPVGGETVIVFPSDFELISSNLKVEIPQAKCICRAEDFFANAKAPVWGGYNYLAIGNSITLHEKTSYWHNEIGMAASDENKDYFHIVVRYLKEKKDNVMAKAYNFSVWEEQSHDRDETLKLLVPYLGQELNLITIQLAENVSDLGTYEDDYISMIEFIKGKAPNARIILVDDFWGTGKKSEIKKSVAKKTSVEFSSLQGITNNPDYCCGVGAKVYDNDGNEHIVKHAGVAKYPGDKGMLAIATRIICTINDKAVL